MNKKKFILLFVLLCLAQFVPAVELDNPVEIQGIDALVTVSANGVISGKLSGKPVTLKVLSFEETPFQKIIELSEELQINGKKITATHENDEFGNTYAVFKINETGNFSYVIKARIETNSYLKNLKDYNLNNSISEFSQFIQPTEHVESNNATVRTIALNTFKSDSLLETVKEIVAWTHNYVTYDWEYYPETFSTIETLESKRGVCDEFATLSAGMFRAKKIPARFVAGVVYSGKKWGNHAWLEIFNPESGWIQLDSTYGEAALIDGTHISMGSFSDPVEMNDRAIFPSTAQVELGQKKIGVEVYSVKKFSNVVSLAVEDLDIKYNEWNDLVVRVENRLNSFNIVPLNLALHEDFLIEGTKDKIILLKPLETKNVLWKIKAARQPALHHYFVYEFKLFSLAETQTRKVKVSRGLKAEKKEHILLKSITPIIDEKNLHIEIVLENIGDKAGEAKIKIFTEEKELEATTQKIEAGSQQQIVFEIKNFSFQDYFVEVKAQGFEHLERITPQEGFEIEQETVSVSTNFFENYGKTKNEFEDFLKENLNIFIVILLALVAVVLALKVLLMK